MENGERSNTALIPPTPARPDAPEVTWRWWEALVVALIYLGLGAIVIAPISGAHPHHLSRLLQVTEQAIGEALLLVCVGGWLWLMHRRSIRLIGVPERPAVELGWGALGGLSLYAGGVFVIGTIVSIALHAISNRKLHAPRQLPLHLSGGELVLAGITVIVLAPVAEELFFRGLLFRSLRVRHSFVFAGGISAFFFGLVHYPGGAWQNAVLLPIVMFFVGFGLAWLYEWRRNIVANMAAHATFNVIGFLFIALVVNK